MALPGNQPHFARKIATAKKKLWKFPPFSSRECPPKKSVLLGRLRLRMSTVAPVQWLKRYPQLHIHLFQESCPFLMSDSNLNKLQNSLNYTSVDPKQFTVSKFRLKPVIVSVLDAATPTNTHPPHEGRQPETTTDSGRQDHFRAQEADHTNQHPLPT